MCLVNVPSQRGKTKALQAVIKGFFSFLQLEF